MILYKVSVHLSENIRDVVHMKLPSRSIPTKTCEKIYELRMDGYSYENITEQVDEDMYTVLYHSMGHCDCQTHSVHTEDDVPWREKPVIEALFMTHNLHFKEMEELLGCNSETARDWTIRHNVKMDTYDRVTSSKTVKQLQQIGAENIDESCEVLLEKVKELDTV